jgi:DNA-binding CsgD family transcriptional regulator
MTSVVFLLKHGIEQELIRSLDACEGEFNGAHVAATEIEIESALSAGTVEVLVIGPTFIESTPKLRAMSPAAPPPMIAVMYRDAKLAVLGRSKEYGVDFTIDVSRDFCAAIKEIGLAWSEFSKMGRATVEERLMACPTERHIPVIDDTDRSIIQLIASGYTDREIAETVFLSHQTVRNRVSRILTYSGARNRTHLACLYLGLVHEGRVPFISDDDPHKAA